MIFRGLSQTRFDDQGRSTDRKQVIFDVNFWKPGKDWRSTVDEFVSALDAEWHGGAKFELTPAFKPRLESLEAPSSPGTK